MLQAIGRYEAKLNGVLTNTYLYVMVHEGYYPSESELKAYMKDKALIATKKKKKTINKRKSEMIEAIVNSF